MLSQLGEVMLKIVSAGTNEIIIFPFPQTNHFQKKLGPSDTVGVLND